MPKGIFILNTDAYERIYGPDERADIAALVDLPSPPQTAESVLADPALLGEVEAVFSGWGCPRFDAALLEAAPKLKVVFYGAGSVRGVVNDAFWDRGVRITSARDGCGRPVAEYTLSQVLFCLKRGWHYALSIRREQAWVRRTPMPGAYGTTVGVVSLGVIGRRVCGLLRPFDVTVLAYDPFASDDEVAALGAEPAALDELFRRADVVSLHTPWLDETVGMITGEHLASMKPNASLINTSRGAVIREDEMIEVLRRRPDLQVVLDVTCPEPPEPGSPLYSLPNVVMTPHIAGAMNAECRRMGRTMVEELRRYLDGEPMQWEIDRAGAVRLA